MKVVRIGLELCCRIWRGFWLKHFGFMVTTRQKRNITMMFYHFVRNNFPKGNLIWNFINPRTGRIQKRALAIVYPGLKCGDALAKASLETIQDHHRTLTQNLFKQMLDNPENKLHALLPQFNSNYKYNLRKRRTFVTPLCKTNRFSNSFVIACSKDYNNDSN